MERKTSLFSFLAFAKASGPHGYQSVGLWACMRRYGLVSLARRFVNLGLALLGAPAPLGSMAQKHVRHASTTMPARVGNKSARMSEAPVGKGKNPEDVIGRKGKNESGAPGASARRVA